MNISGIYIITNVINNKIYIGSSIDIERRWKDHTYKLERNKHENRYLQRSWNKYGKDKFIFKLIEEVLNINELPAREQCWINKTHSYRITEGYNTGKDVDCPWRGKACTIEHRKNLSLAIKKAYKNKPVWNKGLTKQTDNRITIAAKKLKGKKRSDETRRKISLHSVGMLGKHHTNKTKRLLRITNTGKKFDDERRKNISTALIGYKQTTEHRKHISDGLRGKKKSKQHCLNVSKALKGKHCCIRTEFKKGHKDIRRHKII